MNKLKLIITSLALLSCGWTMAINSLCVTEISPQLPAALGNGEDVSIDFNYEIDAAGGARIFIRPFTGGSLSPSYAASPSPIYSGTGSDVATFTISSGEVTVDELRVRITNADQSAILFEYYIPVELYFGAHAARLSSIPEQASFLIGEDATFSFDYEVADPNGARVFIRPYTDGELTPSYAASGSLVYTGSGSDNAFFTISSGTNVVVDSLWVRVVNADQSTVYQEYFVPVDWHFSTVKVSNIVLDEGGDALIPLDTDITTQLDYSTTEAGGIRIFIRPMSDGILTPSYAASGSAVYNGTGSMSGDIKITSGHAMTDQLRIQCTNADQSAVLLEYFVPVHYAFGDVYVSPLSYCPDTPARLSNEDDVNIDFDYDINHSGGVRIFVRPVTEGALTPSYAASGSPVYSDTSSSRVSFTISSGEAVVDHLRVQVLNEDQSELLMEYFEPVHFIYGSATTDLQDATANQGQLLSPYPNPARGSLTIPVQIEAPQRLSVEVYDLSGKRVSTVFSGPVHTPGLQTYSFEGKNLPSGVYAVRVRGSHGVDQTQLISLQR